MKRRNNNIIGTSAILFYFLSFTVGLPMTLLGCITSIVMFLCGYKAKIYNHCIVFTCGKFSGFSLGCFIFIGKHCKESLLIHELGHSVQNCLYGPLMPFIVALPSFVRFHYRRFCTHKLHRRLTTPYEKIWFEAEATTLGKDYKKRIDKKRENKQLRQSV